MSEYIVPTDETFLIIVLGLLLLLITASASVVVTMWVIEEFTYLKPLSFLSTLLHKIGL